MNIQLLLSQFPNSLFYDYIPSNKNTTPRCLRDSAKNNQKSTIWCPEIIISCSYAFFALLSFKFKIFATRDGRPTEIICASRQLIMRWGNIYRKYFLPLNTASLHLLFCTKHSSEISSKPRIFTQVARHFFLYCLLILLFFPISFAFKLYICKLLLTFLLSYPKQVFC